MENITDQNKDKEANSMVSKESTYEDTLLLISGSKGDKTKDKYYAKKISTAILSCLSKHDFARPRCVGAASANNALKGIAIASNIISESESEGIIFDCEFSTVDFNGEEKTGITLNVKYKPENYKSSISKENKDLSDALLKVKGTQGDKIYIKKIANAILSCFEKQGVVVLRAVGAAPIYNALKAFSIANIKAKEDNLNLFATTEFTTVEFEDEDKTGMVIEITNYKKEG